MCCGTKGCNKPVCKGHIRNDGIIGAYPEKRYGVHASTPCPDCYPEARKARLQQYLAISLIFIVVMSGLAVGAWAGYYFSRDDAILVVDT